MLFYFLLLNEKRHLLSEVTAAEKELNSSPPGSIQISKNHDGWKWRSVNTSPGSSHPVRSVIPKKDRDLAEKLCYKQFLLSKLDLLNHQIHCIDDFLERFPFSDNSSCISANPEFQSLLSSYQVKREKDHFDWAEENYPRKTDHSEGLIVPTKSGIMVRSKSEAIIANALTDMKLPFHYEQKLDLNDITIYPDFTILHPRRQEFIIWEHFGMLDYDNYAQNAFRKLNSYLVHDYYPGKNLIVTFEAKSEPIDATYIEYLIYYFFS